MRASFPAGAALALASTGAALLAALPVAQRLAEPPRHLTSAVDPSPPAQPVKLVFVHHSVGENWLDDAHGGLGMALRDANYFVSDTNYGWGPPDYEAGGVIGDHTDIGHWWSWFAGPYHATYLEALLAESGQHSSYSRLASDPGGPNRIVMFKSCFPNSELSGNPDDPPTSGANPLRGSAEPLTVGNAKGIYIDLLSTFAARQDILWVVITAPPVQEGTHAANARAFNTWLTTSWLASYPYANVAVFDFYNVLTSNGGGWNVNDLGWATGNHHRLRGGAIEYITDQGENTSAYPDGGSDNHPSPAGGRKATGEFVPLLNVFYNRWRAGSPPPTPTPTRTPTRTPTPAATPAATATPTRTPYPAPTGVPPRLRRRLERGSGPLPTLLCPPPHPPLVTDLEVRQAPPLAEPPARTPFRDPVFGSCLVRVSDRARDLAPGDNSGGLKNEYSRVQAFNADGTRLLLRGTAATWYLYDAATLDPLGQLPIDVDPRWSATDPNLVYFSSGTRLMSYHIGTGQSSVVHDFASDLAGFDPVAVWTRYEGSPSRDGRWWGFMAQDQSWRASAFLVFDLAFGRVTALLDVRGWPAEAREIDAVTISPLGTYFLAYMDRYCEPGTLGTAANPCGLMVYDRALQNGRGLLRIAGHSDTALDAQGREVLVYQDIDTDHIAMLDLATGSVTRLWPIDFSHTAIGLHVSGRAFDRPGWAVVSTHDGDADSHTWMDDQVFLVELRSGGRVVRLAHTRSLVNQAQEHDYWAEPQATASPDLGRILFTTNWGRSGTDQVETVLVQVPPEAFAAGSVFYVAPGGNDADLGTHERPWRTVGKAAATLQPGDTVLIRAGTYRERVVAERSGTAQAPITYAAYPGETATIDGTGVDVPRWAGLFDISGRDHIAVKGLRVVNSAQAGILADTCGHIVIEGNTTINTHSSGIGVWGSHDVVVARNEVVLACNGGEEEDVTIGGTTRFEVRDNHVHTGGSPQAGGEGICLKDGSSFGRVYRNHVHHLTRLGIYVDAWDKHTHDIEVFANTVHDTENDGITLASEMGGLLERVVLYNNVSYNNRFVGINLSQNGPSATHPMRDVRIVNNTVVGNGVGGWGGGIAVDSREIEGVVMVNNIVADNLSFQIAVGPAVPIAQVMVHRNLIDGFRAYQGEIKGTSVVEGDARFSSRTAFDFRLLAGSPAIDAGDSAVLPAGATTDRDGHPRVVGPAVDLGAYERQTIP